MLSEKQRRSVVLPNSRFKNMWDLLIAILVSYTAIMLPIQLCFDCVPQSLPKNLVRAQRAPSTSLPQPCCCSF